MLILHKTDEILYSRNVSVSFECVFKLPHIECLTIANLCGDAVGVGICVPVLNDICMLSRPSVLFLLLLFSLIYISFTRTCSLVVTTLSDNTSLYLLLRDIKSVIIC